MEQPPTPRTGGEAARLLCAALDAYGLDLAALRRLAATSPEALRAALADLTLPPELEALLEIQAILLTPAPRQPVTGPADVAALLMTQLGHLDQEHLYTLCLDAHGGLQDIALVYKGSTQRALVRVGEIFKPAVRSNSRAIVIAHNHPSGTCQPSAEDVQLTQLCAQAGDLLDILLIDHVIISAGAWTSVRAHLEGQPGAALPPLKQRGRRRSARTDPQRATKDREEKDELRN